jgi:ankyrin repeat protein
MNTLPTPPVSPETFSAGVKRSLNSSFNTSPSKRSSTSLNQLWRSIYQRRMDVAALKRRLQTCHPLDIHDAGGFGVFYHACRTSSVEAIQFLLNLSQIDINRQYGPLKATALHTAACVGSETTIDLLLRQPNIQLDLTTSNGHTPLHIAALAKSSLAAEKLLAAGAEINLLDRCGHTALHLAISQGSLATVKSILTAAKTRNTPIYTSSQSCTPLMHSIALGHYHIMCELVEAGQDVNQLDRLNRSPLDIAIAFQHHDCINYLLDHGADPSFSFEQDSKTKISEFIPPQDESNAIRKLMSLEFWTS